MAKDKNDTQTQPLFLTRQQAYRERMKKKGYIQKNIWIPKYQKKYFIVSGSGGDYWLPSGKGYTKEKAKAGDFSLDELLKLDLNLHRCQLIRVQ